MSPKLLFQDIVSMVLSISAPHSSSNCMARPPRCINLLAFFRSGLRFVSGAQEFILASGTLEKFGLIVNTQTRFLFDTRQRLPFGKTTFAQTVAPIIFSDCNHQKAQSFKAMIGFDWKIPIKSNFSYYKPIKKSDLTIKIPNHFGT